SRRARIIGNEFGLLSPSDWRRQPRLGERACLPFIQGGGRKFAHRLMEQLVEIQPRVEMQKGASKTNRGAIHEHELARHQHRALYLQSLVKVKCFLAAVF